MLTSQLPTQQIAFQYLAAKVTERCHGRRPLTGAAAHAELKAKFPGFSCAWYGFERLGDFFRRGQADGYFTYQIDGTHDRLVPNETIGYASNAPHSVRARSSGFIRRDFWDAFVRETGVRRAYDPNRDTVVYSDPVPDGCIEIQPVPVEVQKEWFLSFCKESPDAINETALTNLLSLPNWYAEVVRPHVLLRPQIIAAWKRARTAYLREVIDKWTRDHSLQISIDAPQEPIEIPPTRPLREGPTRIPAPLPEERVRAIILQALSKMPTQELARIPIPFCYFADFLGEAQSS